MSAIEHYGVLPARYNRTRSQYLETNLDDPHPSIRRMAPVPRVELNPDASNFSRWRTTTTRPLIPAIPLPPGPKPPPPCANAATKTDPLTPIQPTPIQPTPIQPAPCENHPAATDHCHTRPKCKSERVLFENGVSMVVATVSIIPSAVIALSFASLAFIPILFWSAIDACMRLAGDDCEKSSFADRMICTAQWGACLVPGVLGYVAWIVTCIPIGIAACADTSENCTIPPEREGLEGSIHGISRYAMRATCDVLYLND